MTPQGSSKYKNGELLELSQVWANEHKKYQMDGYSAPTEVWIRAMLDPELNPVRQCIGFMETNNHMAINLESGVGSRQALRYYDDIMKTMAKGEPYHQVINTAALSAAVATQYNHKENKFKEGEFRGNEDFAREFHQLFYGILGDNDPELHERISIRNTAKALTDITVKRVKVNGHHILNDIHSHGQ